MWHKSVIWNALNLNHLFIRNKLMYHCSPYTNTLSCKGIWKFSETGNFWHMTDNVVTYFIRGEIDDFNLGRIQYVILLYFRSVDQQILPILKNFQRTEVFHQTRLLAGMRTSENSNNFHYSSVNCCRWWIISKPNKYYLSLKHCVYMHECIHIYLNLNFSPGTIKNGVRVYNQRKLQRKALKIPGALQSTSYGTSRL